MKLTLINNLEIAKKQETLTGDITADDCERLIGSVDSGALRALKIRYEITGSASAFHLPSLHLSINASLPLVCQRCLESMLQDFSLSFDYVIHETEPEDFEGDEDVDWLETSREMNIVELVEDELLIAIPVAPMHENACKPLKLESGEKHNPFAVLKGLVK